MEEHSIVKKKKKFFVCSANKIWLQTASQPTRSDYRQAKEQSSIETVIEAKQPGDDGQAKGQGSTEAVID